MASPQTQDGFTKLANELLDHLATIQMSGSEWQFIMCLIRKTYGFNKKEDFITNSQIATMSGLRKERISEAKGRLLERNIVTEKRNKIALQKDWEVWVELRKSVSFDTEKRIKVIRKSVPTKEKKETITKDISDQGSQIRNSMNKENQIPEVIKLFEGVDPKNKTYYGNKTQRSACLFLLEEYGLEEITKRVEVLPRTNAIQFFPNITTPCQLRDKWVQLDNQIKRHHEEKVTKDNLVAF